LELPVFVVLRLVMAAASAVVLRANAV